MKALIRNSEIVTEEDGVEWIDWDTGLPLTSPHWYGGRFEMVDNYVPTVDDDETSREEEIARLEAQIAAIKNGL